MDKDTFELGTCNKDGVNYTFYFAKYKYLIKMSDEGSKEEKECFKTNNMRDAYSYWRNLKGKRNRNEEKANARNNKQQ